MARPGPHVGVTAWELQLGALRPLAAISAVELGGPSPPPPQAPACVAGRARKGVSSLASYRQPIPPCRKLGRCQRCRTVAHTH
jgi:hypothetical protein